MRFYALIARVMCRAPDELSFWQHHLENLTQSDEHYTQTSCATQWIALRFAQVLRPNLLTKV